MALPAVTGFKVIYNMFTTRRVERSNSAWIRTMKLEAGSKWGYVESKAQVRLE